MSDETGITETPQVSDIAAFKKRKQGILLSLPSGLTMLCRKVELQTLLRQGQIPNSLMGIVQSALDKGKEVDIQKLIDPENLDVDMMNDMYETVNAVVMGVAIQPKVHPVPTQDDLKKWTIEHPDDPKESPDDLRSDHLLYVDEVDDEDKMFLFQWSSGGTADIAQFREEATASLVSLATSQDAGNSAQ